MKNEMELELKHLAPYLPYGIKIKFKCADGYEENGFTRKYKTKTSKLKGLENNWFLFKNREGIKFDNGKPILRSLSELDIDFEVITPEYLQGCCYSFVERLFSEHFDVFGLIPQGLAIDINTLEKAETPHS